MNRQFEFPYNFDLDLIKFLKILDPQGKTIDCIYMPPFIDDYETFLRNGNQADLLYRMTRMEYEKHIRFINFSFPNKIQILLQKKDQILNKTAIQYYLNLGITKFCVASIEQAKLIKEIDPKVNIVGSIAMQITEEKINNNINEFKQYFDGFVLPFRAVRHLEEIKKLPKNFYYILLINAYCNHKCTGFQHWNYTYTHKDKPLNCPGILSSDPEKSKISWEQSARVRPMDLGFFDPYIYIYKLQDRGWPTSDIIRDYILYTTNYSYYPNIIYNEEDYCNGK